MRRLFGVLTLLVILVLAANLAAAQTSVTMPLAFQVGAATVGYGPYHHWHHPYAYGWGPHRVVVARPYYTLYPAPVVVPAPVYPYPYHPYAYPSYYGGYYGGVGGYYYGPRISVRVGF